MLPYKVKTLLTDLGLRRDDNEHPLLDDVQGVVHVGANIGQERKTYARKGLNVLWVEPIPEVFEKLKHNIRAFPNQQAIHALVTDVDGAEYEFNVSNTGGVASSILKLGECQKLWPNVKFTSVAKYKSLTLPTLMQQAQADVNDYQALMLDTQGSELLILRGAVPILSYFKYVKVEVPDFPSYEGCVEVNELGDFMTENNFEEMSRECFKSDRSVGNYYDIVYRSCTKI